MPRKYRTRGLTPDTRRCRFNEAGADAPEIPSEGDGLYSVSLKSFNEAGADAPEIPALSYSLRYAASCFNEAGADAPEIPRQPATFIKFIVKLQ